MVCKDDLLFVGYNKRKQNYSIFNVRRQFVGTITEEQNGKAKEDAFFTLKENK